MAIASWKAALDPYLLPLEQSVLAFVGGRGLGILSWKIWYTKQSGIRNVQDFPEGGIRCLMGIVAIFAQIAVINRQKILEGTRWKMPLMYAMQLPMFAGVLGCAARYQPGITPLVRVSRWFRQVIEPVSGLIVSLAIMTIRCRKDPKESILYGAGMLMVCVHFKGGKTGQKVTRVVSVVTNMFSFYIGGTYEKMSALANVFPIVSRERYINLLQKF